MTNGLVVMTPTSISYSGASASINADGSVVFSACSSLSLNGVFTGDYDNYMVVVRQDNSQATTNYYRLRALGTDNSTADSYVSQIIYGNGGTVAGQRITTNKGYVGYVGAVYRNGMTLYLFGPYLSQPTAWRSLCADDYASAEVIDSSGTHNQSNVYDGFTMLPSAGALDGLVTVFGFNQ
jgi:hypothetical protein